MSDFEYYEDADCLPSVQQLRTDRNEWMTIFFRHSKIFWDGKSKLSPEDQLGLLKAAIDPGCPNHPDLGYYLRHAAHKFAEQQRQWRAGHHEYRSLCDVIHRQRAELARLNAQVRGLSKNGEDK